MHTNVLKKIVICRLLIRRTFLDKDNEKFFFFLGKNIIVLKKIVKKRRII